MFSFLFTSVPNGTLSPISSSMTSHLGGRDASVSGQLWMPGTELLAKNGGHSQYAAVRMRNFFLKKKFK